MPYWHTLEYLSKYNGASAKGFWSNRNLALAIQYIIFCNFSDNSQDTFVLNQSL